jgi:hypothetical protein
MAAHGIDEAVGTGYAEVGTLCIVTIHVDPSSESNPTTQVGTTKERVIPEGGEESRRAPSTLYNFKAASEPSDERLKSQQSYTVSIP